MTVYLDVLSVAFVALALLFAQATSEMRWLARIRRWEGSRHAILLDLIAASILVAEAREGLLEGPWSPAERSRYTYRLYTLADRCEELRVWEQKNPPPRVPSLFGQPRLLFFRR